MRISFLSSLLVTLVAVPVTLATSSAFSHVGSQLSRRQNAQQTEDLSGLTSLLAEAVRGQQTGQCATECKAWVGKVQDCTTKGDEEAIGRCACQSSVVSEATPCGECFNDKDNVQGYQDLCKSVDSAAGQRTVCVAQGGALLVVAGLLGALAGGGSL